MPSCVCNMQYATHSRPLAQLDSFKVYPPDAIKAGKVDSMASLASLFSFRNGAHSQGNGKVLNQDDATAHGGSQSGDTAAGKQGTAKQGTAASPLPSQQTLGATPKVYTAYSFSLCLITLIGRQDSSADKAGVPIIMRCPRCYAHMPLLAWAALRAEQGEQLRHVEQVEQVKQLPTIPPLAPNLKHACSRQKVARHRW